MFLSESALDDVQFGGRFFDCHARFHPSDNPAFVDQPVGFVKRVAGEREPRVAVLRKRELGRHDSDDDDRLASHGLDVKRLVDDFRITVEGSLPESVTQYRDASGAFFVFLFLNDSSDQRWDSQYFKQASRCKATADSFGLVVSMKDVVAGSRRIVHDKTEPREQLAFFPPGMQVRDGDLIFLVAQRRIRLPQHQQLSGAGVGQRSQQHGIHHAEDGRVRADAQGQSDDGNNRERRAATQHAEAVADVLPDGFHQNDSSNIASSLFDLLDAAEVGHRFGTSRLRRHPLFDELLSLHVDVKSNFVIKLGLKLLAMNDRPQTNEDLLKPTHSILKTG